MEDFEVYDDHSVRDTKRNELPTIEVDVTALVECNPPILSATSSANDNMAILEAGFNKEIEKVNNTKLS